MSVTKANVTLTCHGHWQLQKARDHPKYISVINKQASLPRPVKEFKAFKKIRVKRSECVNTTLIEKRWDSI